MMCAWGTLARHARLRPLPATINFSATDREKEEAVKGIQNNKKKMRGKVVGWTCWLFILGMLSVTAPGSDDCELARWSR